MLRYMIELMGADSIALGSVYPFLFGQRHPGKVTESLALDEATFDKLLAGSVLRWQVLDRGAYE